MTCTLSWTCGLHFVAAAFEENLSKTNKINSSILVTIIWMGVTVSTQTLVSTYEFPQTPCTAWYKTALRKVMLSSCHLPVARMVSFQVSFDSMQIDFLSLHFSEHTQWNKFRTISFKWRKKLTLGCGAFYNFNSERLSNAPLFPSRWGGVGEGGCRGLHWLVHKEKERLL